MSVALAAAARWHFEIDRHDQPSPSYLDANGRTLFYVGCGGHFIMDAVYLGAAKKEDDKASITITNGKTSMNFDGMVFSEGLTDAPPNATVFSQADLGYAVNDPNLYEKSWRDLENKSFVLLIPRNR